MHPGSRKELKTKNLINGSGKWSQVDPVERKQFITDVCDIACKCARAYPVAFSISEFGAQCGSGDHDQPFGKSYWLGAPLFIASLVQQNMLKENGNKGLTVFICDDNKIEMPKLSDALYDADGWFDPIYQESKKKGGVKLWVPVPDGERFSNIVNAAFAIKSEHSSFVQVADAAATGLATRPRSSIVEGFVSNHWWGREDSNLQPHRLSHVPRGVGAKARLRMA